VACSHGALNLLATEVRLIHATISVRRTNRFEDQVEWVVVSSSKVDVTLKLVMLP
jgi:hypothetical protein